MAVVPLSRARRGRLRGFGDVAAGGIVTPGVSTYPSEDGTFAIVRGTGAHYGNGLIDGWIIGGVDASGYYALDDNRTGAGVDDATVGRRYHAGREYQTFIDDTPTSPEYGDYLRSQEAAEEATNPLLKAFRDALRQWVSSGDWTGPIGVDGLPAGASYDDAPAYVQTPWAAFIAAATPAPIAPASTAPATYLQHGLETYADGTPVPGGYNALVDYYRQAGTTPGVVNATVRQLISDNPALVDGLTPDQQALLKRTLATTSTGDGSPPASPTSNGTGAVPPRWWILGGLAAVGLLVISHPMRKH